MFRDTLLMIYSCYIDKDNSLVFLLNALFVIFIDILIVLPMFVCVYIAKVLFFVQLFALL